MLNMVGFLHIFLYLCIVTGLSPIILEGRKVVIGSEVGL